MIFLQTAGFCSVLGVSRAGSEVLDGLCEGGRLQSQLAAVAMATVEHLSGYVSAGETGDYEGSQRRSYLVIVVGNNSHRLFIRVWTETLDITGNTSALHQCTS